LPFTINTIWDNPGARTKKVRVGRGPASGLGKNCGRGNKGMYHRAGGQVNKGFDDVQTSAQIVDADKSYNTNGI
jgi:large subunit ribosomal protein L15